MVQYFDEIPSNLSKWVEKQHVFWVATAALSGEGHVNLSPKGVSGSFHIVSPTKVWYEDLSGSGNETISHLREPGNGRITILFNAFEGVPRICRLYGKGTVHELGTPEYEEFLPANTRLPGSRAVVVVDVHKVGTSCGWGVPLYSFQKQRTKLSNFNGGLEEKDNTFDSTKDAEVEHSEKGMKAFWRIYNSESLDGLPGLESALNVAQLPGYTMPADTEAAAGQDSQVGAATNITAVQTAVGKTHAGPSALSVRWREHINVVLAFVSGVLLTLALREEQWLVSKLAQGY